MTPKSKIYDKYFFAIAIYIVNTYLYIIKSKFYDTARKD